MISVVMPTFDRRHFLPAALGSLADQTYTDFEVIIVNDGGPTVAEVVDPWRECVDCRIVELDARTGPAHARNIGVDSASGDLIAFLDDDDLILPNHLEFAAHAHDAGGVEFTYSAAVVPNRRIENIAQVSAGMRMKAFPFDLGFLHVANFIHTGSVVVRSFRDTPVRFDEQLSVCEDWDLYLSLVRGLGYRVRYVDEVTSVYHQLAGAPGLVASAKSSGDVFGSARRWIEQKWPTSDSHVTTYREWCRAFEGHRRKRNNRGFPTRDFVFDDLLEYLYPRFVRGSPPDVSIIPDLFDGPLNPQTTAAPVPPRPG